MNSQVNYVREMEKEIQQSGLINCQLYNKTKKKET